MFSCLRKVQVVAIADLLKEVTVSLSNILYMYMYTVLIKYPAYPDFHSADPPSHYYPETPVTKTGSDYPSCSEMMKVNSF